MEMGLRRKMYAGKVIVRAKTPDSHVTGAWTWNRIRMHVKCQDSVDW